MVEQLYRTWRLFVVALWLLLGCLLALVLLRVDMDKGYSSFQLKFVRWWAAQLLAILGVRLSVHGVMQTSSVWVANHVSWLDIIVLMAVAPSRFLSKEEVAYWPLIGWLARRAGTVFIRRGAGESEAVAQQLNRLVVLGDRVLFFPEGTSSSGAPLCFHARLFSFPLSLDVSVAPIALLYRDSHVIPRADLAYIGDQTFMQSLIHLLAQHDIVAEINFLPAISATNLTRKELAKATQLAVSSGWHAMVNNEFHLAQQ